MHRTILCLAVLLAPSTLWARLTGPPDDAGVVARLRMAASTVAIPAYAKGKVIMVMFQRDKAKDENLAALKGLKYISTVIMEGPGITDQGLKHLAALPTLQTINVSKTSVTGSGFAHLRRLKNLQTVMLDGSALTDEGFANIALFRGMKRIQASNTKLTGRGLRAVSGLTGLEHLDLPKTAVDDAGPGPPAPAEPPGVPSPEQHAGHRPGRRGPAVAPRAARPGPVGLPNHGGRLRADPGPPATEETEPHGSPRAERGLAGPFHRPAWRQRIPQPGQDIDRPVPPCGQGPCRSERPAGQGLGPTGRRAEVRGRNPQTPRLAQVGCLVARRQVAGGRK